MNRLKTLICALLLFSTVSVLASDLYPALTDRSWLGVQNWSQPRVKYGVALPGIASAAENDLFIDILDPAAPVLYRCTLASGSLVWSPLAFTKHSSLGNLDFANSGHTGFASAAAIPNNASFSFRYLDDVPAYTGKQGKVLQVKTDESGVEWVDQNPGVIDHTLLNNLDFANSGHTGFASAAAIPNNASFSFEGLSDIPAFTGNASKTLRVKGDETGIEWVFPSGEGTMDHSALANLDFASSGHTGFASSAAIPENASFSFRYLADIPGLTGNENKTLKVKSDGTGVEWGFSSGEGTMDHSALGNLSFAASGHTGFASAAAIPNNASFSFTGLSDAPPLADNAHKVLTVGTDTDEIYWSPDFLNLNGGDATHTANLDVKSLTVNGEDILGDISAALTAILGE